jgi:hypothetical protein
MKRIIVTLDGLLLSFINLWIAERIRNLRLTWRKNCNFKLRPLTFIARRMTSSSPPHPDSNTDYTPRSVHPYTFDPWRVYEIRTVGGANLCARDPLKVKGKGISGVEGVACKEAETVHITHIIPQWQYFVAHCLSSYVSNVFGLHSTKFVYLLPTSWWCR